MASLDNEKERSKFTVTISVWMPGDENKSAVLKTDLVPVMVRHDKRRLRDTGSCLMVSDRSMEKFFVVGDEKEVKFNISVTVEKQ